MSKLNGMQILELLSDVNDSLIIESVPAAWLAGGGAVTAAAGVTEVLNTASTTTVTATTTATATATTAAKAGFGAWLAKGGWIALAAAGVAAVGIAVGALLLGNSGDAPPVDPNAVTTEKQEQSLPSDIPTEEPAETGGEPESETPAETESETEPETETKPDPETCVHSFGDWIFTVTPTCDERGIRSRACSVCKLIEDEDMPAGLHVFDQYGFCESCHVGRSILAFTSHGDGTCSVTRKDSNVNKTELEIPNYSPDGDLVVGIEPETFANMPRLSSITLPERLLSIGDNAFNNCPRLSGVTLPEGLAIIGEQAFYGCALTEITFPAGLRKLGYGAFGSTQLTEVYLPATITELDGAFPLCDRLTSLTFAEDFYLEAVPTGLASFCTSLKEITLPPTVTSIERHAFASSGLIAVHGITDRLTSIGEIAFSECRELTDFTIPASVTHIGTNAFQDCDSLAYTVFEGCRYLAVGDNPHALLMAPEDPLLTEVTISPDTRFINGSAFRDCVRLQSVIIPEGVTVIQTVTFQGCTRLQSVTLPSTLTEIGDSAFEDCLLLERIDIPDGVAVIREGAFMNCAALAAVKLPSSLTAIEKDTFNGCGALTAIDIPAGVRSIGENAFLECRSLSEVTLPDGLETIGDHAFHFCSFTSLSMPDSVTSLGVSALAGTPLQSIRLSGGLTIIEQYTLENCGLLTEIIIPEGIEKIDMHAISSCFSLKRVSLPRSLKTLMRTAIINSTCEEIDYAGTLAEWEAVVKQNRWYGNNEDLVIHCTDGDIGVSD